MIGYALVGVAIFALVFGFMRGMRREKKRDQDLFDMLDASVAEQERRAKAPPAPSRCVTCGGTGDMSPYEDCPRCGGQGWKR